MIARAVGRESAAEPCGIDYVVLGAGIGFSAVSVAAGLEMLEGEGRPGSAMQTPLASLHGYNGWADQFLSIPADGLADLLLRLRASIGPGTLDIIAREYSASEGGASYGEELDVAFSWPFAERYTLLVKLADYRADSHGAETTKVWLMLSPTFE